MRKPRNILISRRFLDDLIRHLGKKMNECVECAKLDCNQCLFLQGQIYGLKMLIYRANHKRSFACRVKK